MLVPAALSLTLTVALLVIVLIQGSMPVLAHEGVRVLTGSEWNPSEDPSQESYGILPPLLGSLYTAALALALAAPASASLTIFIQEVVPRRCRVPLEELLNTVSSVPTVIFGMWGLSTCVPAVRALAHALGLRGVFGPSILSASTVLAVMVAPYSTAMTLVAYRSVPFAYVEAITSLGATRVERARIILRMILPAYVASLLVSFGRAVGETTAVAMVVGNVYNLPLNPFGPAYTVTSLIANQFGMAYYYTYLPSALLLGALVLLAASSLVTYLGLRLAARAAALARGGNR